MAREKCYPHQARKAYLRKVGHERPIKNQLMYRYKVAYIQISVVFTNHAPRELDTGEARIEA